MIIEAFVESGNILKEGLVFIAGIIDKYYQQADGNIDSNIYPELFGAQCAVTIALY